MSKIPHFTVVKSISIAGIVLCPSLVHANIGLPFTTVVMAIYWILLVTIIAVEAIVLFRRLSLTRLRAVGISALTNIASALLGTILLPISEIALAEAGFDMYDAWTSTVLFLVVLVPSYLVSVWFEALIAMRFIRFKSYGEIVKVFYVANIYSYLLLAVLGIFIDPLVG